MNPAPYEMTMARWLAKRAVRAQWAKAGIKVHYVEASELRKAADAYLSEHRSELIGEAKAWLCKIAERNSRLLKYYK
jgi:hypothetical protein